MEKRRSASFYPSPTDDDERKRKCMFRMAAILCATYSRCRGIVPPDAVVDVQIGGKTFMFFNKTACSARIYRDWLDRLLPGIVKGEISEFNFGIWSNADVSSLLECLRFEFHYTTHAIDLRLSNDMPALNLTTEVECVASLQKVCNRMKSIFDFCSPLIPACNVGIAVRYNTRARPATMAFNEYPDTGFVQTRSDIPIVYIDVEGSSVVVTLHSTLINNPEEILQIVRNVAEADTLGSNDSVHSNNDTEPSPHKGKDSDDDDDDQGPPGPGSGGAGAGDAGNLGASDQRAPSPRPEGDSSQPPPAESERQEHQDSGDADFLEKTRKRSLTPSDVEEPSEFVASDTDRSLCEHLNKRMRLLENCFVQDAEVAKLVIQYPHDTNVFF